MSARNHPAAHALIRAAERDAFAALLARHAPHGAFAAAPLAIESTFSGLPDQPASARADARWTAICRRIAARALAGTAPDTARGGWIAVPAGSPGPDQAAALAARVGPFAFYGDPCCGDA